MSMFVDKKVIDQACKDIESASENFKKISSSFIGSLTSALSTFEGETKDVLIENKIGKLDGENQETLAYFLENQIPDLIMGLSNLLSENMKTIKEGDQQLADAVSGK